MTVSVSSRSSASDLAIAFETEARGNTGGDVGALFRQRLALTAAQTVRGTFRGKLNVAPPVLQSIVRTQVTQAASLELPAFLKELAQCPGHGRAAVRAASRQAVQTVVMSYLDFGEFSEG